MSKGTEADFPGTDRWVEALTWYAMLRESDAKELTSAVGREWQDWYAEAGNRRVFDDVSRLLEARTRYCRRRRPRSEELAADGYDLSVPIDDWRAARAAVRGLRGRSRTGGRRWLLGGLAVAAAAIAVLIAFRPLQWVLRGRATNPAVYETDVGGIETVRLRDGSSIILGARTAVSVAFSRRRRSVRLIHGQAWFRVAHDRDWPFVVTAGDGTITAVGTAFLVTRNSDRVVVAVTEGTVEISPPSPAPGWFGPGQGLVARAAPSPIRVSRGEELAFRDDGTLGPLKKTDSHAATAWTRGRLTFDDQPLRYVIETVDRYSSRHIAVSPAAGRLRFSGIVSDQAIEEWLQSLPAIFPIVTEERGADVRIQMRHSTRPLGEVLRKTQH